MERSESALDTVGLIPLAIFGATFLFVLSRVIELQIWIWSFNP